MYVRLSATIPYGCAKQNCYLCNGGQRTRPDGTLDRYIDTGVVIDHEGHIAICETCVIHMARAMGLLTVGDVEDITVRLGETETERDWLADQCATHVRTIEAQNVLLGERFEPTRQPMTAREIVPEYDDEAAADDIAAPVAAIGNPWEQALADVAASRGDA